MDNITADTGAMLRMARAIRMGYQDVDIGDISNEELAGYLAILQSYSDAIRDELQYRENIR